MIMSLRQLAAISMQDNDFSREYLEESTDTELEEFMRSFDKWWECEMETNLSVEQQNTAFYAIQDLISSHRQYAHEAGIRVGIRLMQDAARNTPTLHEIERSMRIDTAQYRQSEFRQCCR